MFRLNQMISLICLCLVGCSKGFHPIMAPLQTALGKQQRHEFASGPLFMSSVASDGSEYSSKDSDYDPEDDPMGSGGSFGLLDDDEEDDAPVQELKPVPMSKNTGNRFAAIYFDQDLDTKGRDALDLHYDRDNVNTDHVMFCRKRNLYNETFNTDSMVDILRSYPM